MAHFSTFTTDYLYDMYESNVVQEEDLAFLYAELCRRGESHHTNGLLDEIEVRLLKSCTNDDFHRFMDQQLTDVHNDVFGEPYPCFDDAVQQDLYREIDEMGFDDELAGEGTGGSGSSVSSSNIFNVAQPDLYREIEELEFNDEPVGTCHRTNTQSGRGLRHVEVVSQEDREFKRFAMIGRSICFKFTNTQSSNPMKAIRMRLSTHPWRDSNRAIMWVWFWNPQTQ